MKKRRRRKKKVYRLDLSIIIIGERGAKITWFSGYPVWTHAYKLLGLSSLFFVRFVFVFLNLGTRTGLNSK